MSKSIFGLKGQTIIKVTLNAGHDANGNGRRAIIAYDLNGGVVWASNEVYTMERDFNEYFNPGKTNSNIIVDLGSFATTATQIKEFKKHF